MINLGDFAAGQTITRRFTTTDPTGLPVTFAGTPALRVRKGSGAGSAITAGVMLMVDSPVAGEHVVDVDTSASGSYTAPGEYSIEVSAGTVNGISVVGVIIAQFSLADRTAPATGDFTLTMKTSLNAATPIASLSAAAVQAIWDALTSALTTVGSIGKLLVTNIDALISSRTKPADTQARVALTDVLTTYTGNTPQTGNVFAQLPTNFSSLVIDLNGRMRALVAMTKNVAVPAFIFAMTDSTTHAPKTGLVNADFTKQETIDGAAFVSLTGTIAEIGHGYYQIDLTAGELNGNFIGLRFAAGGADDLLVGLVTSK